MKLSVCTDAVFNGLDTARSIRLIHDAGYNAFEFWGWWNKDIKDILKVKHELGMELAAICTKMISLVDSSQRNLYIEGLKESIVIAKMLGCNILITQTGAEVDKVSRFRQHQSLVKGLKLCSPILEDAGITLVVEPLNVLIDHKGYYLSASEEAFQIIDEVGSPKVKVLFDIYHQQITEGNLIAGITRNIDKIGHFHAAGNPGRHELDSGEINYGNILKVIDDLNFTGYVGLEYFPLKDPLDGLKKLAEDSAPF